jgi:hypothetical protein
MVGVFGCVRSFIRSRQSFEAYSQYSLPNILKKDTDIKYILRLTANNGFPLVLSVYLVIKLEYFINELVKNQKEFSRNVTSEIKEINHSINDLSIYIASNGRKT